MKTKRWIVWLCLLALGIETRGARAQEPDALLVDDLSKPTVKAVKDLPLPANLESGAQIQIDFVMWDVDGKRLAKILGDSQEPVIEFIRHNGIEVPGKRGSEPLVHVLRKPLKFDVLGKDVLPVFKKVTAPTVVTLSGQEATMLSGGALPVPIPTDAIGSRKVMMREFGSKFTVKPVWLNDGKIFIDLTAEDSRLGEPVTSAGDTQVPSISGRRVSAACNLQPGETLIILNGTTESAFTQLVEITPRPFNDPQPVVLANPPKAAPPAPAGQPQSSPWAPGTSKPVGVLKGQGVNSDAGVVGNIVLKNDARKIQFDAAALTIDVPKVANLGVEIGQAGALMDCGNPHNPARLLAPSVVLEDSKGPNESEDGFSKATATLKLTSKAAFESLQNLKPENDRQIFLVPIPEGQKALDRTQAQQIFEHAFFRVLARNEANQGDKQQPWSVAEVAPGQKMIRVPVKHDAYLLLPTPTGNVPGFRYVAAVKSEQGGAKRIAGLTVLFVSESVSQLDSLIDALEPTASVTVIEVRDAVVLRGTVTDEAQKKSLIEIAEQLYPKVLNQLKVQPLAGEASRTVPRPERLGSGSEKASVIQQVAGEATADPTRAVNKNALSRDEKRPALQIVPGKLPTADELKELRDDIKGLRQDVQRLREFMERDRKTSAATKAAEATRAEALTRKVEAAKDVLIHVDPNATLSAPAAHPPVPAGRKSDSPKNSITSIKLEGSGDELMRFGRGLERCVSVATNDQRIVTFDRRLRRVSGFDPLIAEVRAQSPSSLQIGGHQPGITNFAVATEQDSEQSAGSCRFTVLVADNVTCNFENESLERVIKVLADQAHINVVLDRQGLEEEGLQPTQPISISLKNVSLLSTLKLVLSPLNLSLTVEGGVLVVTSEHRSKGELVAKVYAVADLVVPLPGNGVANGAKTATGSQALIDLVTRTIQPSQWDTAGGSCSTQFDDKTLSLVIRASADLHQEVAELLSQIRRLQDTQVVLEMAVVSFSNSASDELIPSGFNGPVALRSQVLTETARQSLFEKWQADRHSNIIAAPKVTLFNGQTASLTSAELGASDHPVNLVMNGVASGDRKSVRLSLGVNGESFDAAIRRQQETLQEGQSLILDITDDISAPAELLKKLPIATDSDEARDILKSIRPKDGSRVLLLVTPRVIVVEEETVERLGEPMSADSQRAR